MKYVKRVGFAAAAVALLVALAGSGTASGTVLCKTPGTGSPTGTTCPEGWAYGPGTRIHAVAEGTVTITTEYVTVHCNEATIEIETTNEGSATETVKGPQGSLIYGGCNCEVKVLKSGTVEIHAIAGTHNGTLTGSNNEVTTTCSTIFGKVHCIYVTEATDLGTITGGSTATLDLDVDLLPAPTNFLCSSSDTLEGSLEITDPKPLYIASHT